MILCDVEHVNIKLVHFDFVLSFNKLEKEN